MVGFKKNKEKRATCVARFDLTPESETLDERLVTILIVRPQVLQQTTTATDQLEQTTTAVVVLLVGLEVSRQVGDALGQECDLIDSE